MFSGSVGELLIQVIKSWQVLAVTGAIVVYLCLVFYVARSHHRPRAVSNAKPKKSAAKAAPAAKPAEKDEHEKTVDDDLGLSHE